MIKAVLINFLGIFNSRILGFIRDLLSASILGANIYSDIFFVAFKFPNLFRRIFAEGAFTQSFLPSLAKSKEKARFAFVIFLKFFIIILILSLIVTLFKNFITDILAYGFDEKAKKAAAPLIALNFWYLDLIFAVTFLASLLQYRNHFTVTAFSTALLNISLITALTLSENLPPRQIVWNLSFAVITGGIAQLAAHLAVAKKKKILKFLYIGYKKKVKADTGEFNRHFLPSLFGNSTAHISAFLDTWLATFLSAGSISYLYYANRLFQLPFALFVIATSTVFFPKITKLLHSDREKEALNMMRNIFWILLYLLIFATVVGIADSREIIHVLFERGAFTRNDTIVTADVLIMYLIGLIPYGIGKLFSSYLYATHRHLKAAKLSAAALAGNIVFSVLLIFPLKVYGLALSSSIGGVIMLFLYVKEFSFKLFFDFFEKKYLIYLILCIFASIIAAIIFKKILLLF